MCRAFLTAAYATAPLAVRKRFAKAAVLGSPGLGYTIELRSGTQIEVGKQHCRYCARADALMKLEGST